VFHRSIPPLAVLLAAGASLASASPAFAGHLEVVNGTAVFTAAPGEANDLVAVTRPPVTQLTITDAAGPISTGPGCEALPDGSATCPGEDVQHPRPLLVRTGNRDDRVLISDSFDRLVTVRAGSGDDVVDVSSAIGSPALLEGGPGDDQLTTTMNGNGPPVLRGGPGDDTLTFNENGGGLAYGGPGNDQLVYNSSSTSFEVLLDGGAGNDTYTFGQHFLAGAMVPGRGIDTLDQRTAFRPGLTFAMSDCPGCVERVIGSAGADVIVGDASAQAILGDDGDDVLDGGGGPDAIAGQGGDDTITSRDESSDVVTCGTGIDTVHADRRDLVSGDCEIVDRA
jgi:hypothetical protein